MVVTVTMNPAIDKTVDVDHLERGGLNRVTHVEQDAGGKGINVSKTIHELGGSSVVTGFIAGNTGKIIQDVMDAWHIPSDFIEVNGQTRTNTKIFETTGELTEVNEPGPLITEKDMEALLQKLDHYAEPETLFVLAGSVPKGVDKDIYRRIIEMVHAKGAKVLLDADGELFTQALAAGPDMIKPNRVELEQELLRIARELMTKGIDRVVVSMGKSGALFLGKEMQVRCPGLKVKAHSTVGAGDAMVAALSYAWDKKLSNEETIKLCMAVSAGAVMTVGTKPPTREMVEELMVDVTMGAIA